MCRRLSNALLPIVQVDTHETKPSASAEEITGQAVTNCATELQESVTSRKAQVSYFDAGARFISGQSHPSVPTMAERTSAALGGFLFRVRCLLLERGMIGHDNNGNNNNIIANTIYDH